MRELTCTCWGPGVWTPAETQRNPITSGQGVEELCDKCHQHVFDTQTPRAGVYHFLGKENHVWTLPYPASAMCLHLHTHTLFTFMFSFCRTQLVIHTGGLNLGASLARTCSGSGSYSGSQLTSSAPCLLVFITHGLFVLIVRGDEQH